MGQHRHLIELLKRSDNETTYQKCFLFFSPFILPPPQATPCTEQGTSWAPPFAVCQVAIYCHMSMPACSNFSLLYPQIFLMWDFVRSSNDWSQHISPPTYSPVGVTEEINSYKLRKSCLHLKESAWLTTVTCFCTGTKSCRLTPGHQPAWQGDTLPSQTVQSRQRWLWKEGGKLHLQHMEATGTWGDTARYHQFPPA